MNASPFRVHEHALDMTDCLVVRTGQARCVRGLPVLFSGVSCPCERVASGAGEMMNRTCAVDQARGNTSTGADAAAGPVDRFLNLVREAIDTRTLQRLVLSRPARKMLPPGFVDEGPVLQRVRVRPVRLRDGVKLAGLRLAIRYARPDRQSAAGRGAGAHRGVAGRHAQCSARNLCTDGRAGLWQAGHTAVPDEAARGCRGCRSC